MNIVLVTDMSGIEVYKSWSEMKKHTSYDKSDFTKVGSDYILNSTQDSYEIAKDIKLLEHVAAKKMFTKNKMDMFDLISIINLALIFMLVVK